MHCQKVVHSRLEWDNRKKKNEGVASLRKKVLVEVSGEKPKREPIQSGVCVVRSNDLQTGRKRKKKKSNT